MAGRRSGVLNAPVGRGATTTGEGARRGAAAERTGRHIARRNGRKLRSLGGASGRPDDPGRGGAGARAGGRRARPVAEIGRASCRERTSKEGERTVGEEAK